MSQEALAEKADLSAKYPGEVERGLVNISLDVVARIVKALSIKVNDLTRAFQPGQARPWKGTFRDRNVGVHRSGEELPGREKLFTVARCFRDLRCSLRLYEISRGRNSARPLVSFVGEPDERPH